MARAFGVSPSIARPSSSDADAFIFPFCLHIQYSRRSFRVRRSRHDEPFLVRRRFLSQVMGLAGLPDMLGIPIVKAPVDKDLEAEA